MEHFLCYFYNTLKSQTGDSYLHNEFLAEQLMIFHET